MSASSPERFWLKVHKSHDDGCWEWIGCRDRRGSGYGKFRINGENYRAHRLSWEMANGPIPPGMFVCHHCDNKACVRPTHLYLGTAKDNMKDALSRGLIALGDESFPRRHPERMARGERSGIRKHPERYANFFGWAARHPERMARGERSGLSKLKECQVVEIRTRHAAGETMTALSLAYGVEISSISKIVHRKLWTHVA